MLKLVVYSRTFSQRNHLFTAPLFKAAIHRFRFAPICLHTLGVFRVFVETRFASDALVVLTTPLAIRELLRERYTVAGRMSVFVPFADYCSAPNVIAHTLR